MTMKLRNRLIALFCLLLFLSLGGLIFATSRPAKPFAVILFVADNLNPSTLTAARIYSGGGENRLQVEEFPNTALCRNNSSDFSVPDAASASSQIASGQKVPNSRLCLGVNGAKLPSLLEDASSKGRSTGLISTGTLLDPGAASQFAKTADASALKEIASQFSSHAPFDFVAAATLPDDGKSLLEGCGDREFKTARSLRAMETPPSWNRKPLVLQLDPEGLSESLPDLVRLAIGRLQFNGSGYLLVVDDQGVGTASASNDGELMLRRIVDLDRAIAVARRYAGENSLIVVTGRANVAGFSLNAPPFLHDKGVAVLAMNNLGYPSVCWSTGPGYPPHDPSEKTRKSPPGIISQPAAFMLPKGAPTCGDVLSAGTGRGSEKIHGFLDLTDIHRIVKDSL